MGNHVIIKVGADGAGFNRTMSQIEKRAESVGHHVGDAFKEGLVGLVGAATIGAVVDNMFKFAAAITQASERLGVATDKVQILRHAAREAGKDLSMYDKVFSNQLGFRQAAQKPGSAAANVADKLGFSPDELQHTNKYDFLKKALEATTKMDRSQAEALLGAVYGKKNAGPLLAQRENILAGKGAYASDTDLRELNRLKDAFEDLTDIITAMLIPAFMKLVEWITGKVVSVISNTKSMDEMDKEAFNIATRMGKTPAKGFGAAVSDIVYQGQVLVPKGNTPEAKQAYIEEAKRANIARIYGEDVLKELEKTFKPSESFQSQFDKQKAARDEERKKRDAELNGPDNVTPKIEKSGTVKAPEQLKGSNPYLQIGSLFGVDVNYRLERLSTEANQYLRQIADNTTPDPSNNGEEAWVTN